MTLFRPRALGLLVWLAAACTSTGTAGFVTAGDDAPAHSEAGQACAGPGCDAGPLRGAARPEGGAGSRCTRASDCSGDLICSDRGECMQCTRDADCEGGEEDICDLESGRCVECTRDADCGELDALRCAPSGQCATSCADDAQCEEDERCVLELRLCAECVGDADCTDGAGICDPQRLECLECARDADCGASEPHCVEGQCDECAAGDAACEV